MNTQPHRLWILGGIVGAIVLIAASWLLLVGPKLDDADSVRDQTADAQQQNAVLQAKVDKLQADSAGINDLLASLDALRDQLPVTSGLDSLTRQITEQASAAKVDVTSIVIGVPAVVKPSGSSAGSAPTAGSPATDDSSDQATTAAADPAASADPATSAVAPQVASVGLYSIPVTVQADGTLAAQLVFLKAVQQQGPRSALVSSVQFAPAPDATDATDASSGQPAGSAAPTSGASQPRAGAGQVAMTLQVSVFVAPQSPDDAAALRKQLGG